MKFVFSLAPWIAVLTLLSAHAAQVQIIGWGDNSYNQTDPPSDLTNAVSVCAGINNAAILSSGSVRGWGLNGYLIPPVTGVKQVSTWQGHGLILFSNGTVTAWGANQDGQANVPPGLSNVMAVAAGSSYSLALKDDGTVVGWGREPDVVPLGLTAVAAIAAGGFHNLALRSNGTVVAWGANVNGQANVPPGLSGVVAVSAGGYHSTALKSDGTVVVWGGQDYSSLQPPAGLSGVAKISAGGFHNLALLLNGSVVAWGSNSRGQSTVPPGLKDVVAVSAGHQHSIALTTSLTPFIRTNPLSQIVNGGGTLNLSISAIGPPPLSYQWWKDGSPLPGDNMATLVVENVGSANGGNYSVTVSTFAGSVTSAVAHVSIALLTTGGALINLGGVDVPGGVTDVVEVDACSSHALALKADGTVVGWGWSQAAIVPQSLGQVIDIAVELNHSLALRADGTVVGWGFPSAQVPTSVSNVIQIAVNAYRGLALLNDGRVLQWNGGIATDVGLTYAVAIDGGGSSAVALVGDGRVAAWNLGGYGGGEQSYVPGLAGITAISFGDSYLLALRNDGTVAGGGIPAGLSNVTAVAAGGSTLGFALRQNGTVVGWGGAPNTAGLTNVTRINANGGYGLAITRWPVITAHPQSTNVNVGETVTLRVEVKGAGPFTYQWRKDGTSISGANGKTLTLKNVQFADIARYTLMAGNAQGTIESLPARLDLFGVPQVALQPVAHAVFVGAKVVFSASAVGAEPLFYQWFRNGIAISGATSNRLVLAATASDAGSYSVLVSNSIGHATGEAGTLKLTGPHTWAGQVPGTVVGLRGPPILPGLTNIIAVAAGGAHALALRADGTLTSWGSIRSGENSNDFYVAYPPVGLSNVAAVSVTEAVTGEGISFALRTDGTVARWGARGEPHDVPGAFGIIGVEGGLLLRSDRSVLAVSNVISTDASMDAAVIVKDDGTAIISGSDWPGGVSISNIIAGEIFSNYAMLLRADGRVIVGTLLELNSLLRFNDDPTVDGVSNVIAIAAGNSFGLALKNDGTVIGIGIDLPPDLSGITAIAAGGFGLAISTNPPQPRLAITITSNRHIGVISSVSVPNYILESATQPGSFSNVPEYTNAFYATNSEAFEFKIIPDASMRIFRLRKQP